MISETVRKVANLFNCDHPLKTAKGDLCLWITVDMYEYTCETKFGTRRFQSAYCSVECGGKELKSSCFTLKECDGDVNLLIYSCLKSWCLENDEKLKGTTGKETYEVVWKLAEEAIEFYEEYAGGDDDEE